MSLRGFSLHLSCGLLINYGHVLIFISLSSFMISIEISILNSWLILGHFLSISSKLISSIFFLPTSFLLIHLGGIIFHAWWSTLILWFLYLSSYIKNFIFCSIWSNLTICYFSSISFRFRSRGAVIINFNPWFSFINFILDFFKSKFICILCPDVFPIRPHIWIVFWSQIDLTLQFLSLTTCVLKSITHYSKRGKCMHPKMIT